MLNPGRKLIANENTVGVVPPSVQSLYDMAQTEELFLGVERVLFDQVPHLMLYAAVDPAAYAAQAHTVLEFSGVPTSCHRFDDLGIKDMIKKKFEVLSPRPTDSDM